jgi:hypothetical protein
VVAALVVLEKTQAEARDQTPVRLPIPLLVAALDRLVRIVHQDQQMVVLVVLVVVQAHITDLVLDLETKEAIRHLKVIMARQKVMVILVVAAVEQVLQLQTKTVAMDLLLRIVDRQLLMLAVVAQVMVAAVLALVELEAEAPVEPLKVTAHQAPQIPVVVAAVVLISQIQELRAALAVPAS